MDRAYRVSESGVQLTFLRLAPGCELVAWERLRAAGYEHVYKQFGYFDLLCLAETSKLQPTIHDFVLDGMLDIIQLPCIGWEGLVDHPAQPTASLAALPLLAVQFLRLHTSSNAPLDLQLRAARHLSGRLGPALAHSCYTTLSYSELVVLTASDDIEQLVATATDLALHTPPDFQFSSSQTLYHVSYPQVLAPGRFELIRGKVPAQFFASFHLPDRQAAIRHWREQLAPVFGEPVYTYGGHDLKGETEGPRELSTIAKAVFGARKGPLLETVTRILNPSFVAESPQPVAGPPASGDMHAPWPHQLEELTALSKQLVEQLGRTDVLSLRLLDFLRTLHGLASDPRARNAIHDLQHHFPFLVEQLRALQGELATPTRPIQSRNRLKDVLVELVYLVTRALEQRYPNIEAMLEGRPAKLVHPLKTGFNRLVLALGDLPRFIYEAASPVGGQPARRWTGFVTYEDEHGFYRLAGDVITCPMEALWYPLTRWATVTHEIAHGIASESFGADRGKLATLSTGVKEAIKYWRDETFVAKMLDELVAQWIDFECFQDGSKEEFIRSTWYGLSSVPSVWWNTTEYLARTVLIEVYDSSERLATADTALRRERLEEAARSIVKQVEAVVEDVEDAQTLGRVAELERTIEKAAVVAELFLPIVAALHEQRDRLRPLREVVNAGDRDRIREETAAILEGYPVGGGLTNPLRTVMALSWRDYRTKSRSERWRADFALISSLADDYIARLGR